jgi:hypothetical protein
MIHSFGRFLLAGFFAIGATGCEPRPVVVDPDDGDTTVIEDDADVDVVPDGTTTEPRTGVDVQVGGEEGVDVNVNPAPPDSTPTGSPAGTSTDATQNPSTPNAQQ